MRNPVVRNVTMPALRPCEPPPNSRNIAPTACDLPLEDASSFEDDLEALHDFLGMTDPDLLTPL